MPSPRTRLQGHFLSGPARQRQAATLLTLWMGLLAVGPCEAGDGKGAGKSPPLPGAAAGETVTATAAPAPPDSPIRRDWRDEVLYFLMIDRFADGDPSNNDQGKGEFNPASNDHFNGGDLAGIRSKLDYIQGLGVTGLWITPPMANLWWDPYSKTAGYHGYWADHFAEVDRHFGSEADYQALARALRGRGLRLVQDIVLNHTGNFFDYDAGWDARDPAKGFRRLAGGSHGFAPRQYPFNHNNAADPADRKRGIYHWTPDVADYQIRSQQLTYQMGGLDDLNSENPLVRRTLRESHAHWIRSVGVDAFRVDTAFYVTPEFLHDFMESRDPAAPGMSQVWRASGRTPFSFGEGWAIDRPGEDKGARKIESYVRLPDGRAALTSMINFPLYGTLADVFAKGRPPADLAFRLASMQRVHRNPALMPTFIDNHDVDRFLAGGSAAGMKQALLAMLTLPGIPVIYYGTEQGFTERRGALFAAGFGARGRDHFDTGSEWYRTVRDLVALRRQSKIFSRGTPRVVRANAVRPGVLAYTMHHAGQRALVLFNTSDDTVLADNLPVGSRPGQRWQLAYSVNSEFPPIRTVDPPRPAQKHANEKGQLTFDMLSPRSASVWIETRDTHLLKNRDRVRVAGIEKVRGTLVAHGTATARQPVCLVVDDLRSRQPCGEADAKGRWTLPVADPDGSEDALHRLVAMAGANGAVSEPRNFKFARDWTLMADVQDPANDDRGPQGRYRYPTDPGWASQPGDIRRVQVWSSGGALKLTLTMPVISTGWAPQNGFDRVAFTAFIGLPDEPGGSTLMPQQNASLPEGMKWHRRLRVNGWSNALFSDEGADAVREGRSVSPSAQVRVDAKSRTVSFVFPAGALGNRTSLDGVRLYLNTWDYDAGYRGLAPEAGGFTFGGGEGARDPLILDDTPVITLRPGKAGR